MSEPSSSPSPFTRLGRYWHIKGYFTVEVVQILVTDRGRWFIFFSERNCDNTYAEHEDATQGDGLVKKHWFEDNGLKVMHEDRFVPRFSESEVPFQESKIKHYNEFGQEIALDTPSILL